MPYWLALHQCFGWMKLTADHLRNLSLTLRKVSIHQTRQRKILGDQYNVSLSRPCGNLNVPSRAGDHHSQRSPAHKATVRFVCCLVWYSFVYCKAPNVIYCTLNERTIKKLLCLRTTARRFVSVPLQQTQRLGIFMRQMLKFRKRKTHFGLSVRRHLEGQKK